MVKYKEYFKMMVEQNRELFQKFMVLSTDYMQDKNRYKEQFDKEGREVLDVVEFWERKLCKHMEKGSNSVYSSNLSEKFRGEVKKIIPCFDEIGVKKSI
jgi:hypothetical protein